MGRCQCPHSDGLSPHLWAVEANATHRPPMMAPSVSGASRGYGGPFLSDHLMNRKLAAFAALVAIAVPVAAFARTTSNSELQRGHYSMPYACSVQSSDLQLYPVGSSVQAVANDESSTYTQNDDTLYSLSQVTFVAPRGDVTGLTAQIQLADELSNPIVRATGVTANESGYRTVTGIAGAVGRVLYNLNTSRPAFRAGDYEIKSTLTCAQAI